MQQAELSSVRLIPLTGALTLSDNGTNFAPVGPTRRKSNWPMFVCVIPFRVSVTLVMAPVTPDTLMVDGYSDAGVGGAGLVRIEIGDGLEKTVSGRTADIGRATNETITARTKTTIRRLVSFLKVSMFLMFMVIACGRRCARLVESGWSGI